MRGFLVGNEPGYPLGYTYVQAEPYDAVVIGSLTLGELLHFSNEQVLTALDRGMPVLLYTPGLPDVKNRALAATLAARQRELKNWGVVFTAGGQRRVITAQQARQMKENGIKPAPGAVLTPLAKEILEG